MVLMIAMISLFSPSNAQAAWSQGSAGVTWSKALKDNSIGNIAMPKPVTWDVNIYFKGKVTLFSLNTFGSWDVGYKSTFDSAIGEGVMLPPANSKAPPELISRLDAKFSAKAWAHLITPGVDMDSFFSDPVKVSLADVFNVIGGASIPSEFNFDINAPSMDIKLPFVADNQRAVKIKFKSWGIYDKNFYNPSRRAGFSRKPKLFALNINRIKPLRKIINGNITFFPGVKGDLALQLKSIQYFNGVQSLGVQTSAKKGIDVSQYAGQTLKVDGRDYTFALTPKVTLGMNAYAGLKVLGWKIGSYIPKVADPQNPTVGSMIEKTISIPIPFPPVHIPLAGVQGPIVGNYVVPAVAAPVAPVPAPAPTPPPVITPPPGDTVAPTAMAILDANVGATPWPRYVTITATDNSDPSPSVYFTIDGSTPSPVNSDGVGLSTFKVRLDSNATVKYIAIDKSANKGPVKSFVVSLPSVSVTEINLPAGEFVKQGSAYTKRWMISNNGSVNITGLTATLAEGQHALTGLANINIGNLAVGAQIEITAPFTVPATAIDRSHWQTWRLIDAAGNVIEADRNANSGKILLESPIGDPQTPRL